MLTLSPGVDPPFSVKQPTGDSFLCPLFVLCAHEVYVQENEMGLVLQTSRDRSVSNFFSRPLSLVRFL